MKSEIIPGSVINFEPNRAKAIQFALAEAETGNTILITGKGCETY